MTKTRSNTHKAGITPTETNTMPVSNLEKLIVSGDLLPLDQYDYIIQSYSGGKDSLGQLLHIMEQPGVRPEQIELWHQHVDGEPGSQGLMDWPCTEAYVRATAKHLALPLRFQWRVGGFEAEMLWDKSRTNAVCFERTDGTIEHLPTTTRSKLSTRLKFPQVSADLSVRWCSAYLKIDVARRTINNDERFDGAKVLFLTGERRQESTARSKYKEVEPHACSGNKCRVDQWRSVIDWEELDIWRMIEKHGIKPHPAYRLGWGRVSCMACIFGDKDQWASVLAIAKDRFDKIAAYEQQFGVTIQRKESIIEQAAKGNPFVSSAPDWLIKLAMEQGEFPESEFYHQPGEEWQLPAGAYKRCGGPT